MSMPALFKGRLSLPAIAAPLFIISVPDLVIAQCKAGVVGSFPALNARPPGLLDEWLARIKEELAAYDKAHPERPSAPSHRPVSITTTDAAAPASGSTSGRGSVSSTSGGAADLPRMVMP